MGKAFSSFLTLCRTIIESFFKILISQERLSIEYFQTTSVLAFDKSYVEVKWKVKGALFVKISPEAGFCKTKGQVMIGTHKSLANITLTAYGFGKSVTKKIIVKVISHPAKFLPKPNKKQLQSNFTSELTNNLKTEKDKFFLMKLKSKYLPMFQKNKPSISRNKLSTSPAFINDSSVTFKKFEENDISKLV